AVRLRVRPLHGHRPYARAGPSGQWREEVNWIAIIIAVVVNSVLGSLWFSPMLFSKKWQEWEGHKEGMGMGAGGSVGPFIALSVVATLMSAIALAWFMSQTGTTTLIGGALIGLYEEPSRLGRDGSRIDERPDRDEE